MCATCGCGNPGAPPPTDHKFVRTFTVPTVEQRRIAVEHALLDGNNKQAAENRAAFVARKTLTLNLMSSPGSGKTTLLERTLREFGTSGSGVPCAVIEGDQATDLDAERIRATGTPATQVNTGTGCHLDARMIAGALGALPALDGGVLFVENVGNLVCPALFDLGEAAKVVVISVPEGDEKPSKYPHMFRAADVVVLNKVDLLPYVAFDRARFAARLREINPRAVVFELSATRGDGLSDWFEWIRRQRSTLESR